jgi:hypothetical protein
MTAALPGAPGPPPVLVQYGWCPVIMIHDMTAVLLHFAVDHGIANVDYSLRYGIAGPDWDIAELDGSGNRDRR